MAKYLCVLLGLLVPLLSAADDQPLDHLSINGFGTLGMVYNPQDKAAPVRKLDQPDGAGKGIGFRQNSLLGLQLRYDVDREWGAVVQGLSRYDDTGSFEPVLSLAFLRYSPSSHVHMRLGRIGWDVYMLSESRYVGYAYPWLRPPVELFGLMQLNAIDGGDVTLTQGVGSGVISATFFGGNGNRKRLYLTDNVSANLKDPHVWGGHLDYRQGSWFVRAGYTSLKTSPDYDYGAIDAGVVAALVAQNADLNDLYGFADMNFTSLSVSWEPGPFQLLAMANEISLSGKGGHVHSALLSAGYVHGKYTPYLSAAWMASHPNQDLNGGHFRQRTLSAGLRYDVTPRVAIKGQIDHVSAYGASPLLRQHDDYGHLEMVTFGLGLDFIF
ncbi:hypothetical protein [Larsenimonas rhizosphaerae]|uniref:hypothetical protein n=1 Tax=Larsenimonas rhizosphaerae TaxID=2944682 RepID=UPI0020337FC6|nr:hypothetical protein [Larsenimonas rhizosphaerae]MCM2129392.1 hypothetical protein [Larsenimonas rhizosphaerae]